MGTTHLGAPGGSCVPWWVMLTQAHLRCPSSGIYVVLTYKKNKEWTFGTERRCLEAELGQEHFCPSAERFCRGNFPPGGGNHRHHHHQQLSHIGEGCLHQHLHSTNSSQTLVHLLCSIFVPVPQIGTCG